MPEKRHNLVLAWLWAHKTWFLSGKHSSTSLQQNAWVLGWLKHTQSNANNEYQGTPFLNAVSSVLVEKQNWTAATEPCICGNVIRLLKADFNPLTKTLWHSPSSFSQPTNTKAEFALLRGCNPGLALLLVLGFPPSVSLFCLNIWVTFGAQTNHSDVCKQRQTYTIITTSKSCLNTWKKQPELMRTSLEKGYFNAGKSQTVTEFKTNRVLLRLVAITQA